MKKKITKDYDEPVEASEQEVEEEFRFDPALARQNILPKGVRKVRVELFLDADVLEFFTTLASKPDAASYHLQINQTLREAMVRLKQIAAADTSTRKTA